MIFLPLHTLGIQNPFLFVQVLMGNKDISIKKREEKKQLLAEDSFFFLKFECAFSYLFVL